MVLVKKEIRKIAKEKDIKLGADALETLDKVIEETIVDILEEANSVAKHAKRKIVKADDIKLVL